MASITSFIRWAGGKSWFIPHVSELIEGLDYNNYYEPFMGGASIFFSLNIPHEGYLSDLNEELVEAFCAVRDNPKEIIKYLKTYKTDEKSYTRLEQPNLKENIKKQHVFYT